MAFGFADEDLPFDEFMSPTNVLTFGVAPTRVDLLSEIDGVDFLTASSGVARGKYGGVEVNFIGREDLLKNKRSTSRARDLGDVEELTKLEAWEPPGDED